MKDYIIINIRCFLWLILGAFICLFSQKFAIKAVLVYGLFVSSGVDELLKRNQK